MSKPTIGVIGTGKMGLPIIANLLKSDYQVIAFNRSPESLDEARKLGAVRAVSVSEVSASAEIILTSLTNQQSVRDVYLGTSGLVGSSRPGQTFIDTSTNDIALMREIGDAFAERDAGFVDAPVSGGVPGAVAGSLTVMAGAQDSVFDRARPVLEVIGANVHHLGGVGAGTAMKLVNQLLVGVNMAAVAEALVFGANAGARPEKILEVISTSFGGSRMLDRGIPLIVDRNFAPATPVDLIRKDMGIVMDQASEQSLPLNVTRIALELFDLTSNVGYGPNDMTAIVIPLESDTGVDVS